MKIGNTELRHGVILAPMAGFTDRAMRLVCKKYGCEYTVTEMVSAVAVSYNDKKTAGISRILSDEEPVALQIFGSDPDIMARSACRLSEKTQGEGAPCAIDINMGCPVKKIFSNGEGSALMKDPDLIYRIVKSVSSNISLPCTVKMRLGVDSINVAECAQAAQSGGAKMICVHGRTRTQMYSGTADMHEIANVKKYLHIPLVANGDITSYETAMKALEITGADGIMIGRGAIGNPFIFEEITAGLEGRSYTPPTIDEIGEAALFQLREAVRDKGEAVAMRESRKQIALYFKGFAGCAQLRVRINQLETYSAAEETVLSAIENFKRG